MDRYPNKTLQPTKVPGAQRFAQDLRQGEVNQYEKGGMLCSSHSAADEDPDEAIRLCIHFLYVFQMLSWFCKQTNGVS